MGELEQLIQQAIVAKDNSQTYQKLFTRIMFLMQQSGQIRNHYPPLDLDSYHNALLKTWEWLRIHLHEYDPEQGNIYSWFNTTLRFRIRDEEHSRLNRENNNDAPYYNQETGQSINSLDLIPDPNPSSNLLQVITQLLAEHQQYLIRIYPRNCSEGNCDYLLKNRLPLGEIKSWESLAQELNSTPTTLNSHYRKKCLLYLRSLLENEGYDI